ncbi:activity-regulated cytoskeleton associated protein 1-like [Odontomachus brunneus]|uniref:activity-regulated cytoskeleton associated protein 1-like n=1 Tax=Odontomachus brunneus TaxID=486640 RepID=UPI0013F198AB|nr:activity-regulated cytoskeleton associated protein 1-like [Odontomachus brunneus]
MRRWNLSFSGARGYDVETFLMRIEEGRELVPIANGDLFKCLPFFLTGIALQWYRIKKSRWSTWREFEAAVRGRFGDPDYQFALRDEIMRRTQGEQEPVADYLTCLLGLFGRLDPP